MAASVDTSSAVGSHRPADRASLRVSRVVTVLGLVGLAAFGLVFLRLAEDWRVAPSASHHITIFGQRLGYPAANASAVIIVVLAGLGAIVVAVSLWAIAKEAWAARALARRLAALDPSPGDGAWVIDDDHPAAFCAGLLRPRVYVTSGAIAVLSRAELEAVLLHERHHARRRDPLRAAVARVIARSLFFVPGLSHLRDTQQLLAELGADEGAVAGLAGDSTALAGAMLSFGATTDTTASVAVDPARIDALLGEPPSWRFPTLMCLAGVTLLAVIVTLAILVGREAAGSATLAPPFLSAQPCIVMLALTPCAIAVLVTLLARGWRRGKGTAAGP